MNQEIIAIDKFTLSVVIYEDGDCVIRIKRSDTLSLGTITAQELLIAIDSLQSAFTEMSPSDIAKAIENNSSFVVPHDR